MMLLSNHFIEPLKWYKENMEIIDSASVLACPASPRVLSISTNPINITEQLVEFVLLKGMEFSSYFFHYFLLQADIGEVPAYVSRPSDATKRFCIALGSSILLYF